MSRNKVVISIGGSILIPDEEDSIFIKKLAKLIRELNENIQMIIVCGGGKIARYYADTSSELGATTYQQDMLGIGATRLNAELLALSLGDISCIEIPHTAKDAVEMSQPGKVVIMGGTEPGHTTDAVATMVAREMNADRVVNATSVDAVYSADPKVDENAVRYSKITIDQLGDLVYKDHGAGKSSVFDPLGVKIAKENNIDILIVSGRDLEDLGNAIKGSGISGTFVDSH